MNRIFTGLLVLTSLGLGASVCMSDETPLNVVLGGFTCSDNSYRSSIAALGFSDALQAELTSKDDVIWVERKQLQVAEQELSLIKSGQLSMDSSLRIGKWLKADLLIMGRFITQDKARMLRLEIIDLDRADVLSQRLVTIQGNQGESLVVGPETITAVASLLHELLPEARVLLKKRKEQIVMAPLFFANIDVSQRLDFLEKDIIEMFKVEAGKRTGIHVLFFPRTDDAQKESELVVGGLAACDQNAWQKVADVYAWGTMSEIESAGVPFQQVDVKIDLYVWDGVSMPRNYQKTVKVSQMAEGLRDLAGEVLGKISKSSQTRPDDTRKQVAESLVDHARKVDQSFANAPTLRGTREGRQLTDYRRRVLEVAHFFRPEDLQIHKYFLLARNTEISSQGERRECVNDYIDYFHHCGMGGSGVIDPDILYQFFYKALSVMNAPLPPDMSSTHVSAERKRQQDIFANTLKLIFTKYASLPDNQKGKVIHPSAPFSWMRSDLTPIKDANVRVNMIQLMWPFYVASLQSCPGYKLDQQDVDDLKTLFRSVGKEQNATDLVNGLGEIRPKTVRQSEVAKDRSMEYGRLLEISRLPVLPPELGPKIRKYAPGLSKSVKGISFLNKFGDQLLFILRDSAKEVQVDGRGVMCWWPSELGTTTLSRPDGSNGVKEVQFTANVPGTLYVFSANAGTFENLSSVVAANSDISSLCQCNRELWITLREDGVWCLNLESRKLSKYGQRDGLTTANMYTSALGGQRLFAGGGRDQDGQLNSINLENRTWTRENIDVGRYISTSESRTNTGGRIILDTASDRQVSVSRLARITGLAICQDVLLIRTRNEYKGGEEHWLTMNVITRKYRDLDAERFHGPAQGLREGEITLSSDEKAFWIGTLDGMLCMQTDASITKTWYSPCSPRRVDFRTLLSQWRESFQKGIVRQPFANTRPSTRLADTVTAFAHDGDFVWIATETSGDEFIQSDTEGTHVFLLHKPSGKWVGHFQVSHGDIRVNGMEIILPRIKSLLADGDTLWIGLQGAEEPLLAVEKAPLLAISKDKWMSDAIPDQEVSAKLEAFPARERVRYAFLLGNNKSASELLAGVSMEEADLEVLFIRGFSLSSPEVNQIAEARKCFQEVLRRRKDGYWSDMAREALQELH